MLNVAETVAAQARLRPNKIGASDSRRELTFRAWHERANRLANALAARGLRPGDRVALLAYNCVEWMELYVGLARAGLVAVPINFRLVGPEILYIVQHCEARALVVQDGLTERVESIREQLDVTSDRLITFGAPTPPVGWTAYESLLERASAGDPAIDVGPNDAWALMYTSGTTGRPKGAIRSHAGSAAISLITALDMGFTSDDTGLLVMPM
jgi:acyl-CoA synthetase (AMP-forming)/AMP-acid ligase II